MHEHYMDVTWKSQKSEEYYTPSQFLVKLIDDILRVEATRKKHESNKFAGEEVGISEEKGLRERENRVNRNKTNILNKHIFRAMANLTFLLEQMQQHPYIRERFEDEVKSLFLAKSIKNRNKAPIFLRFLRASCNSIIYKREKDGKMVNMVYPDFRLILCELAQQSVYEAIVNIAPFKFASSFKLRDETFLHKTLYADMDLGLTWTSMLAQEAYGHLEFDKKTRPALF